MHEVGIMRDAVAMALEAAKRAGATRVTRINIEVGRLSGVVPQALEFAFDAVTDGTMAEGSKFEWQEVPVTCGCQSGCPPFAPDGAVFRCPICGEVSVDIRSGRELRLLEIDVE